MPTLLIQFPGGRYHATPWGHHVNEGLIEWPPSPWRLLRALLSVGYTACGWDATMSEPWRSAPPETMRSLLLTLAGVLPRYQLPPAAGAHTRHYMPVGELKPDGKERTTLVFDTWAQLGSGELAVTWDVDLAEDQRVLLAQLADSLNYLGRSESWVQARLAAPDEAVAIHHNCEPCAGRAHPGPGWEQTSLLAPEPAASYDVWRASELATAAAAPPASGRKGRAASSKTAKAKAAAEELFPRDLLACLQVDTTWLASKGWSQPPGTRRELYWRRSDALLAGASLAAPSTQPPAVACVLLALASQSGSDHALPAVARTLPQAERLHRQAVAAFGRMEEGGDHSPLLTGCDEKGKALRGAHVHCHVLPLDLDRDGHIEHILIWAPAGLPEREQRALRRVRSTYTKGGVGPLRLAWAGSGSLGDMEQLSSPYGETMASTVGRGRVWISATPFVPPRHLKPRGRNSLAGQVAAELESRGLPIPTSVEWLAPHFDDRARAMRHHVRVRRFGPEPPADIGFMLRLAFADDVTGPLCLGYGSHFGLGRFERS